MQEIMSATGADGGDLKFIKDEKLSRKANSPPCTSDHVITFFFQITWCVTSQLNTTKVIILFALFFQVLSLTFCFGSMWPILQENVSSLTRNQDLQILKDSRKSKTRRESGEKRQAGRYGSLFKAKGSPRKLLINFETHSPQEALFYLSCLRRLDFPSRVFIHSYKPCIQISSSKVAQLYFSSCRNQAMFADGQYKQFASSIPITFIIYKFTVPKILH